MALKDNEIIPVFKVRSGQDGLNNDDFTALIEDTLGIQTLGDKIAMGNNINFNDAFETLEIRSLYDDYPALTNFGVQLLAICDLTGTVGNNAKMKVIEAGHTITAMDPGTEANLYFAAAEMGCTFNPGSAYILPEYRTYESDITLGSGTLEQYTGFNARFHSIGGGNLTDYVGFCAVGAAQDTTGALVDNFTGFLVRAEQRADLKINWLGDWHGMIIDNPNKIDSLATNSVLGTAYGMWFNGQQEGSQIAFGDNKNCVLTPTALPDGLGNLDVGGLGHIVTTTATPTGNALGFNSAFITSGGLGNKNLAAMTNKFETPPGSSGTAQTGAGKLFALENIIFLQGTANVLFGACASSQFAQVGATTTTDAIGYYFKDGIKAAGTLTNLDAIRIEKQTAGTNNRGIAMVGSGAGADIDLNGDVQISSNGTNLELSGTGIARTVGAAAQAATVTIVINGIAVNFLTT